MKLNWGLIGCGDISRKRVAPALRDLKSCRFIGVSRAKKELARSFAQEFGAEKWYGEYRELLQDEDIQAVYIATPPFLHAEQVVAAAEAGKHIICEKPMAMSTGECDRMMQACRTNGVKLSIAYYRHLYPLVGRIKEILKSGEIGTIILSQINAFEYFDPGVEESRTWLFDKERAGGGPMMDFGCHRIEVLLNLFGAVKRTVGVVSNVLFDREVEDSATALFEFKNGSRGVLTVSTAVYESKDALDIYGSRGSIHVPLLNRGRATILTEGEERDEDYPPHANFHQPYIEAVTAAILTDSEVPVGAETGRAVAQLEEEIYGAQER